MPYVYPRQDKTRQDKTRQTNYGFLAFRKVKSLLSVIPAFLSVIPAFLSVIPAKAGIHVPLLYRSRIKYGMTKKRLPRPSLRSLLAMTLIVSLLTLNFAFLTQPVFATSSPWTQTDWVGGSGQTSWLDATKYDSSSSVTTSTAGQVTLTATSNWYNTSWLYRRKITFDNSAQAENLTNFPVLVKLDSTRINYSNTQNSGQDIRFTDSDGTTLLSYEIEKWDETGNSFVWVKVPQIDASSSSDYIYIYYGNSSATDGQAATSVWDANYKLVQHLKETSGTTTSDSTSNANNGTKLSATEPNPTTSGQINGAQDFDGSNDTIDVNDLATTKTLPFTVSAWFKADTLVENSAIINKYLASSWNGFQLFISSNSLCSWYLTGTINNNYTAVAQQGGVGSMSCYGLSVGIWYQATIVVNASGMTMYINGSSQKTSGWTGTAGGTTETTVLNFGKYESFFDGVIDEIRISSIARSAPWIAASYKSEADTLNTFASEESQVATSGTLTSSIFDSEFTIGAAWGTLTYTATTPSNTSVSVKARTSNSSSMTGATAFSSCSAITSGSDISSNSCVTDSHRYIQYQLTLANTDAVSTPTFQDISIAFATYDAVAPSISLTALSPDPNTDTTPTLSGTATEGTGTVSNVQFQMDATSGSWSSCTASDGSFNSASEAFTCTPSALSDGSHTIYVRATDSNGNTTASGSESSDTFTIDATAPVSISLDSPGDNNYTNNERPMFKWQATSDATAGLSKYVLDIDNPSIGSSQPSGDFTIDDIPTSRTTDYETNKYLIHYENFNDSDSNNNYISVYTKSHSDWSSSENDGKLREGKVSWKVKAVDSAGNETSSSRTLFVDRTNPNIEFTQVNNYVIASGSEAISNGIATSPSAPRNDGVSTTDKTPTIFGKITDPLAGADNNGQTKQDENGPKVASGPKEVTIKIEKVEKVLGIASNSTLITLYTINMDNPYYTCEPDKTIDNSKQQCDKYLPFSYTPENELELGTYKITLSGKDKADNSSSKTTLTVNITTLAKITTKVEKKIIEEALRPAQGEKQLTPEEKEQVKNELEITKPTGEVPVSALEKTADQTSRFARRITDGTGTIAQALARTIGNVTTGVGNGIGFAFTKTGQGVAFVGNGIGTGLHTTGQAIGSGLAFVGQGMGTGFSNTTSTIGSGYNNIAHHAPGVTKNMFLAVGNGVSITIRGVHSATSEVAIAIGNGFSTTSHVIASFSEAISNTAKSATSSTHDGFLAMTKGVGNGIANSAFTIGEKTDDVSHGLGTAIIKFGYLFVPEPTRIYNVNVARATPTSMTITWKTNHPASGKVNYGLTADYGQDVQTDKRITHHEFTVTGLQPNTTYYYEVMSQNRNYVYDANHTFTTPKEK